MAYLDYRGIGIVVTDSNLILNFDIREEVEVSFKKNYFVFFSRSQE